MLILRNTYVICNFLIKISYGNPDVMIENDIGNYFERGKHANKCLNKSNDPLYVPKISKLHDLNKFSYSNCNYYERRGDKYPLYASSKDMMCSPTNDMQWYASTCSYLVINVNAWEEGETLLLLFPYLVVLFTMFQLDY
jgi:hypothetical protein